MEDGQKDLFICTKRKSHPRRTKHTLSKGFLRRPAQHRHLGPILGRQPPPQRRKQRFCKFRRNRIADLYSFCRHTTPCELERHWEGLQTRQLSGGCSPPARVVVYTGANTANDGVRKPVSVESPLSESLCPIDVMVSGIWGNVVNCCGDGRRCQKALLGAVSTRGEGRQLLSWAVSHVNTYLDESKHSSLP